MKLTNYVLSGPAAAIFFFALVCVGKAAFAQELSPGGESTGQTEEVLVADAAGVIAAPLVVFQPPPIARPETEQEAWCRKKVIPGFIAKFKKAWPTVQTPDPDQEKLSCGLNPAGYETLVKDMYP
jgi:hypothetical protein